MTHATQPQPAKTLLFRIGLVGIVLAVTAAIVLPLGWSVSGHPLAFVAGGVATAVCFVAAALALGACHLLRGPQWALASVLMGMTIRLLVPLLTALVVRISGGPLADAGFLYYLVIFYPVTLTVETMVSLPSKQLPRTDVPAQNFAG